MKYLLLSDIHVDTHFEDAVGKVRSHVDDPEESVTIETLEHLWKFYKIPETEGIFLAGDYSNDYLTFTRIVPWLSSKYKRVVMVLGNHDLVVRGSTPSKANLPFASTEQKIARMKDFCRAYDNVFLLDGEDGPLTHIRENFGGCMGMCDFKCEAPSYGLDAFTAWRRNWYDGRHWKFFNQEPAAIWNHYDKKMMNIVQAQPKVIMTHFVPYQLGVSFDFRNDPWNYAFYFDAEKYLEEMPDDSYWFCGHVHGRRKAEYVNSKGNRIHIWCNPLGYPGERTRYIELLDYTGEKLERGSVDGSDNDFIIDL